MFEKDKKLKMFQEWLEYQQAYDDRDEEAERWAEFIQIWENDKALNRLAESYSAESEDYGVENVWMSEDLPEQEPYGIFVNDNGIITNNGAIKKMNTEAQIIRKE